MKFSGLHFKIEWKRLKKANLVSKVLSCYYTCITKIMETGLWFCVQNSGLQRPSCISIFLRLIRYDFLSFKRIVNLNRKLHKFFAIFYFFTWIKTKVFGDISWSTVLITPNKKFENVAKLYCNLDLRLIRYSLNH